MRKILTLCISLVLVGSFLSSCDLFNPKPPLPDVTGVTVAAGAPGETLSISWAAVSGAESYTLFYTNDGTTPTTSSSSVNISATSYVHSGLVSSRTYKYMVGANAAAFRSSYSTPTAGNLPDPVFTLTSNFGANANAQVLLLALDVPYDPVTDSVTGSNTLQSIGLGQTDASGNATMKAWFDRSKYLGFTIVVDNDSSGTLTTGDLVPGSGGVGSYSYMLYKTLRSASFSYTFNLADYSSGATHIY